MCHMLVHEMTLLFDIFLHNCSYALIMLSVCFELCSLQNPRKHIVFVSKSLPHECSNTPPWIMYNQFVPWCFFTHTKKYFLLNLTPKEHGTYWSKIIFVASCWNDCVVLCKSDPPGIVPDPQEVLLFFCLHWDPTLAVILSHLVLKLLCLTRPCQFFSL